MDSLMWSGEDIMNQSRGSVEGNNNQMSKVPTMKSLGNVKPANPLHMTQYGSFPSKWTMIEFGKNGAMPNTSHTMRKNLESQPLSTKTLKNL